MIVLLGFDLGAVAWLMFGRRRGFVTADVTAWPPDFLLSGEGGRPSPARPRRWGPTTIRSSSANSIAACAATTSPERPPALRDNWP